MHRTWPCSCKTAAAPCSQPRYPPAALLQPLYWCPTSPPGRRLGLGKAHSFLGLQVASKYWYVPWYPAHAQAVIIHSQLSGVPHGTWHDTERLYIMPADVIRYQTADLTYQAVARFKRMTKFIVAHLSDLTHLHLVFVAHLLLLCYSY